MPLLQKFIPTLVAGITALSMAGAAHAEGQIRIAQQFGIGYLILDVVQDQKLIEKQGKKEGIDIKVEWASLSGSTGMNEALLAGALDVVSAGAPPALVLWDRTRGRQNVKAIASLGSMPNYLLSNNPNVRSLKDLSDKDRIAVPAAGVGYQSRTLQIETARLYGRDQYKRFDSITVSLSHPDATAALMSGGSEINAHFSSPPFQYQALENRNVHKVISSYDILGGRASFNFLYTTQKFHDDNPKTYRAFYNALVEAAEFIRSNKARAADIFIRVQKSRLSPEFVRKIVDDPEINFTVSPERSYVYAEKLYEMGVLKNRATSWKDYFFEQAYAQPGS